MSLYVDIQAIEDALLQGRRMEIRFEFVADDEGTPIIDVAVYENGHLIHSSIGEPSFEHAINSVQEGGLR